MYTYAFLFNSSHLELPEGIWGSLELIGIDRLAALVEPELSAEALQHDRQLMQAVLSHDRVIQETFQQTTVLPLRFGTYFVSRHGLLDHLQTHQPEYIEKLMRLQNQAEYMLKLTPLAFPEPDIASDTKGKAYFLAKKQIYQDQASWQQQQQTELQQVSTLVKSQYPAVQGTQPEADEIERLYLLAPQDMQQQDGPHQQLANWQQLCPSWQLTLSEPLPPYHFV